MTKEKTFAYSLLMHAELESYIEDMVSEIADAAFALWRKNSSVTFPLACMVIYKEGGEVGFSENIFNIGKERKAESIVAVSKRHFDYRVKNNHGVRHKNICKLFMSIGFIPDPSEEALLNSLDGFGAKRGEYAHTSPDGKLLSETDPITEANEINVLIENMKGLDEAFVLYREKCGL
ncbi:hypothetical protein [Chelativorans sp. YIM 93263]|uniref:hypothetical protein n=1 Tax=Chelativorans sp. YIM 93263 TaxID=2906648 RepID=UPI002379C90F|nr:hypothetical protein [Chelativorans sp. YIM 93263]